MSLKQPKHLESLVHELRKLPQENEWVEFKLNNAKPEELGEYISALANSAALCEKAYAYLVWGLEDKTHEMVGTSFSPLKTKVGEEELENWLLRLLSPKIHFHFYELALEEKNIVLLEISRALGTPVQFKKEKFIRIGSYKKKLRDFPEKERKLWRIFDTIPFEHQTASESYRAEEVLQLLDYPTYFHSLELALPESREAILAALYGDGLIKTMDNGLWTITNLAAILFARRLNDFQFLKRKAVRVIVYHDNSRIKTIREHEEKTGYVLGFENILEFINTVLPKNEIIEQAMRKNVALYPELAVRELVANALIHQDFSISGTGPMIEIFQNRLEITNPGIPLVDTQRFLDTPPRSRNETLASLMRRVGLCEERGSGVDKVVSQTEFYQLPAPSFEVYDTHTRSILFAPRSLNKMDQEDRIRACYLHACLKYVNRDLMTNRSVRERFGIEQKNSAVASRIIKEANEAKKIRPYDPKASKKLMRYIPFWA